MNAFDTVFPADSLEFCPNYGTQDIFVCGTYKLDDQPETAGVPENPDIAQSRPTQHRRGLCLVFRIDPYDDNEEIPFHQIQSIKLPAILDMKWRHHTQDAALGIADSEGTISLFQWKEEQQYLDQVDTISCASSDILCLSLDWSGRRTDTGTVSNSLIVSLSNGSLCLLRYNTDGKMRITNTWHGHDFEPWVATWDYWNTNVVYSGGDDLKLKAWDVREDFSQPIFVNKRFDAGITSIQSNPHVEHIIAVGSYNNTVKLFDTRKLSTALHEVDVGGGAWRVKWHPSQDRKNHLLVACMHDGFKVIDFDGVDGPHIMKRFDAHKSLAYGADWSFASSTQTAKSLVGSCSFYDHALYLWRG